jgi:hypothetical protein
MPIKNFGDNIVVGRPRGILTMFMQILEGLQAHKTKYACLVEHDVLYHPEHFDFRPPKDDVYYYNEHTYKVDSATGQAVFYYTKQTSGLCANRELLIGHYQRRIAKVQQNAADLTAAGERVKNDGFSRHMGFEPGCPSIPRGVDNYKDPDPLGPLAVPGQKRLPGVEARRRDPGLGGDQGPLLGIPGGAGRLEQGLS